MNALDFVATLPKVQGVGVIIRNQDGKILVQDHVKRGFITCPIGTVEHGELHLDAMIRELKEELGIEAGEMSLLLSCNVRCGDIWVDTHIFELQTYRGEITNKEPHKHRSLMWYSKEELNALRSVNVPLGSTLQVWLDM